MNQRDDDRHPQPPALRPVPTIHDVARQAGVSTSTVSRSLSGGSRVSEATRERVRVIADELGFRPSRSAQALRSSRTRTIGLLAPNLENPIAYDHLRATIRAAYELGYAVLVGDGQETPEIQDAELARMCDYRVDGIIIGRGILPITPSVRDVLRSATPIEPDFARGGTPEIGARVNPYRDTTSDTVGAITAYRHLVRLGHRRFAMVLFEHAATRTGRERHRLLDEVVAAEGVRGSNVETVLIREPEECLAVIQRLMAPRGAPTAIVSGNGRLTPYVLEGLHTAGIVIPRDASFVSFGDSQWHRAYTPPISVIREDYVAVARRMVERLVARIEGTTVEPDAQRSSEFVMRASMAEAPLERRPAAIAPAAAST